MELVRFMFWPYKENAWCPLYRSQSWRGCGIKQRNPCSCQELNSDIQLWAVLAHTHLRAASSNSWGRFVAAMTSTLSSGFEGRPSNSTRNSVLRRRLASCSPSRRSDNSESTSSMKMMDGWNYKCQVSVNCPSLSYFNILWQITITAAHIQHSNSLHCISVHLIFTFRIMNWNLFKIYTNCG